MKKKLIIGLSIAVGVIGVGAAVAYFFFWDDISLLFGGTPETEMASSGAGVDLLSDFASDDAGGPANRAGTTSSPEPSTADKDVAADEDGGEDKPAGDDALELDDDDSVGDEPTHAVKPQMPPPPPSPVARKSESVPSLSRQSGAPKTKPAPVEDVEEEDEAPKPKAAPKPQPKPPAKPARPTQGDGEGGHTVNSIHKKAQSLIQSRKYAEAEALLARHLAANPSDGDAHFMMGFLMMQTNRKANAVTSFQKAIRTAKDPDVRQMAEMYLKKFK